MLAIARHINYLIIGQGLAGSALAWELVQRGNSVLVLDKPGNTRASSVAAGLFNPITGKFMTKAWKADVVFPVLEKFYSDAEKILNKNFLHLLPIYRPSISDEERLQWKIRSESEEMSKFLLAFYDEPTFDQVNDPFGGIDIAHSGYVNVGIWLESVRNYFFKNDLIAEEHFSEEELVIEEKGVRYKSITADKIIFAGGLSDMQSRWFNWLPFKPLKGETLEVSLDDPAPRMFNRGAYLVPTERDNIYNAGATYQHPPFIESPSQAARQELQLKLETLLAVPFKIIHQDWGIRPTTPDRRPFMGFHLKEKNVIIFNGLGTKGVSLAPYLAQHLADWLEGKIELSKEVNIFRFKALYSG
ncbi:MAG: FAD-binding oxidoreductase [Cyclobacteriaceae bacterium]|nr:FAD-binding oxidoreductase [Cyclobacteriaceae bacterium]